MNIKNGFNKTASLPILKEIVNNIEYKVEILEDRWGREINVLVVEDKYKSYIEEQKIKTFKDFMTYKNAYYKEAMYKSSYEKALKRQKEEKERKESKKNKKEEIIHYGVYGIYQHGELVYIGSTMRDFEDRFYEHKKNFESKSEAMYVYKAIENNGLEMVPIIDVNDLKVERKLTRSEVEAMELALIHLYKPKGNYAGIKKEFKFYGK